MNGGTQTSALSGRRKTARVVRCGGGQEVMNTPPPVVGYVPRAALT